MTYASFFSGCGGLDLGINGDFEYFKTYYKSNSFQPVFANDIDKKACKTYKANLSHCIINDSIDNIDFSKITANLIIGGFPCQPFSYAGKRLGENDNRGKLYLSMINSIEVIKPKIFLMENVKGLIDIDNGKVLSKIIKQVSELGYNVNYKLYEAKNFGTPQNRSRIFIVGLKNKVFGNNFFEHPFESNEKVVTSDILLDLEFRKEGDFPNHFWSKAKRNKGQGNKPIDKNGVSPAIRAENHRNIEFHYNNERRLSAREAASLTLYLFFKKSRYSERLRPPRIVERRPSISLRSALLTQTVNGLKPSSFIRLL